MEGVVASKRLALKDVHDCVKYLSHEVPGNVRGNSGQITIREDFNPSEYAALITCI